MNDRLVEATYPHDTGQRLDLFLVAVLPEFSRSRLQGWIEEGRVTVDDRPARKSGQLLEKGARVRIYIPPPGSSELIPEDIPLDIVFENEDVLVVNKPAGMVVHPAVGHERGTLAHAALAHAPGIQGVGGDQKPGIVHRLDKDTSGLILVAKNDAAHVFFQDQFRDRLVHKTYLALVDGAPPTPSGRVEAHVGRDSSQRRRMTIRPPGRGRMAVSQYRTLERFAEHTLLEVEPVTGRTHQIRLHLAYLGCPVVGDRVYGRARPSLPIGRHFLHAARLEVRLPGEDEPRVFEAPLPPELVQVLERLRAEG